MDDKSYTNLHISFAWESYIITIISFRYGKFKHSVPLHSHANHCYEIHLIADGYGQLLTDHSAYDLSPGSLFVTGPNVTHEQLPLFPDSMAEYCIYARIIKKKERSDGHLMADTLIANPFLFGCDNGKIQKLIDEIIEELESEYPGYEKQAEALFSMTFVCLARRFIQPHVLKQTPVLAITPSRASLTEQARSALIEDAFLSDYSTLTLTGLADNLHLSRRQTERLIQKLYNKTFYAKKLEAQMSAASHMLKNSKLSITSIAEAAGYSSQEYFSNAFRKYYGCSPGKYRKTSSHYNM